MSRFLAFLIPTVFVSVSAMAYRKLWEYTDKDCGDVYHNFLPCYRFITGKMNEPTQDCCWGVAELNSIAKQNSTEPQRICQCIEFLAVAGERPFLVPDIDTLPIMCRTHLSFPISVRMDCFK
ncbi:Nonspecific lipid-transfer protein 3 precursor, putative [Ricinus communis]|uniref:Nonspecific lipid-transfer protein 3, putative n=2 Tax=Ricinus communis TaxID=3988 RepID=B9RVW0_RICCO|nr:Nonspecific lipid-transfer protein 3 precursor, putative [Ricinus communis]